MSTQKPWDVFLKEHAAMVEAGFDPYHCGLFAWNEAVNAIDKAESREQTISLIAAVRGFLNRLEDDVK